MSISAVLLFFSILYFGSPYYTLYKLKNAIENKDSESISKHVDFQSLRTNLKEQMNAMMASKMAELQKDNPFAALGMVFASKMVDTLVDSMVTPYALNRVFKGEKPNTQNLANRQDSSSDTKPFKEATTSYHNLNTFYVVVPADKDESKIVMEREGMFDWKVKNVILPIKNWN